MITASKLWNTRSRSRPASPASVIATPSRIAKTITCNISPSAIARNGFDGKIRISVSVNDGACCAV